MNIRSVTPQVVNLDTRLKTDEKPVRTEHGNERDADGRRQQDQKQIKEILTAEEVELVLKHLRSLDGVKHNNLSVQVLTRGNRQFFIVNDSEGKVVRRLSAAEAWLMHDSQDQNRGQIINKTA